MPRPDYEFFGCTWGPMVDEHRGVGERRPGTVLAVDHYFKMGGGHRFGWALNGWNLDHQEDRCTEAVRLRFPPRQRVASRRTYKGY